MGAGAFKDDDEGISDINVVPLVDIVLVLLIIFMVTTQFLREEPAKPPPAIEVELPSAATGGEVSDSLLTITINKRGELFRNGELSSLEALREWITARGASAQDIQTIVAADKDVSHGAVIAVVDELRKLGLSKFAINTKPQEIR